LELEAPSSRYDEPLPSQEIEERGSSFDSPSMELEDSSFAARQESPEPGERTLDDDFGDSEADDVQGAVGDEIPAEGATPSRRRRRRRGRRGVHREDAFLGIDRLATEDIVGHEPPALLQPTEEADAYPEEISLDEEITSIEIGGDEEHGQRAPAGESEV
jgi:hypothetical protein